MRMKRNRTKMYFLRKAIPLKDREGNTYVEYEKAHSFKGESWPAGGKIQAEMYGNRLSYIQNVKIQGKYIVKPDTKGALHYIFENGLDVVENDGVCLYVSAELEPDYKIIYIRPYQPLLLEVEKT